MIVWRSTGTALRAALLLAASVCAPALQAAEAGGVDVPASALSQRVGHAFDLETGELIYREVHRPRADDGRLVGDRVSYVGPDGDAFARKTVDYTDDPVCPWFRFEDARNGYVEGLEPGEGDAMRLFHEPVDSDSRRTARLDADREIIADAGFDMLVYREFDRLLAGEELEFPFAVPSRGRTYDFRARRIGEAVVLGEPAVWIRLEPSGLLTRWLTDPIEVAYHRDERTLLRYEGISNVRDQAGDSYRVRIDFPPAGREPEPPA